MVKSVKFDPKKLAKLNNPERLKEINPELILRTINLQNPELSIDIGAGTGFFAKEFVKINPLGKIYACDSSKIMIDWMNENINEDKIVPLLCTESSIKLEDEIADFIYMINLHHELHEPDKLMNEAFRLLKKDAKIAIIDWKKIQTENGPPTEIRVSEQTVISQLQNANFKNIKTHDILKQYMFITAQK